MSFSLNEIEAMGRRAARGAGLHWGIAEEAGKAVRWLAGHGLPGSELLADLLARNSGLGCEALGPVWIDGVWQARSGWLCSLIAGVSLVDRADEFARGRVFELGPTTVPVLLAPYAARASRATGAAVEVFWPGVTLTVTPDGGLAVRGASASVVARSAERARCQQCAEPPVIAPPGHARHVVDAESWRRLDALARRTYAPATEASRLAGAGAGLSDND